MEAYEMHAVILNWKQCPSVRYSGKPFFFVAFANGVKWTVVWDRIEESWTVTKDDVYQTNVSSVSKGKKYVEREA